MKNSPRKLLIASASMLAATSLMGQDLNSDNDLQGSYAAFTRSQIEAAAFDAFDQGFEDDVAGSVLDYFKFGVRVSTDFNSNIFNSNTNEVEDVIIRMSIPISVENEEFARHHWGIHYTPKINAYIDNSREDGVDHFLNGNYTATLEKTVIDVNAGFSKTRGSDRFASGNIAKNTYTLRGSIYHQLTGKTRLDLDLGAYADDFKSESLFDRERYNARLAWQYQVTGKTTLGPYVGYEFVNVEQQPNHKAYSAGVKATYQALQKTTFSGFAGVENRRYEGGGVENTTTPTFEFAASYQLTGKTNIVGTLYNTIRASYSDFGRSYKAFGLSAQANYKMSHRVHFNAGLNLERDDYFSTIAGATGNPDSDYRRVYVGGSYRTPIGLTVGSRLSYANNDAGDNTRDYDTWVFSLDAGYDF